MPVGSCHLGKGVYGDEYSEGQDFWGKSHFFCDETKNLFSI